MSWIDTIATWFSPPPHLPLQPPPGPLRRAAAPSRRQHRRGQVNSRPNRPVNRRRNTPAGQQVIAFHGTPDQANAASIFRHGWMIGPGNGLGDGIYFSKSLAEAKAYARTSGVYLRCRIDLGKSAQWTPPLQKEYQRWCKERNVQANNSAITAFLRQHGYTTLVSGNVVVVLWPQSANPSAWKRKFWNVKILSVHRSSDDARIRV